MTWVATGTAAMTAAEIAAAEAAMAAAATAAAEAAAASAASTAAAGAAAPAITEVAATALPEVAGTILPEASGILQAAPGVVPPPATPLPPAGIETVGQAAVPPAPATPLPPATPTSTTPAGIEQVAQPGIQTASGPATSDVASFQSDQSILNMMQNYQPGPPTELSAAELQAAGYPPAPGATPTPTPTPTGPSPTSMTRAELAQMTTAETGVTPAQPLATTPPGAPPEVPINSPSLVSEPPTNPFVEGFNSVTKYIENNPFKSAILGYTGLSLSGALNQPTGQATPPQKKTYGTQYRMSPNFQPGPYTQPNVYRPTYASGGIISLQNGGGPVERMSQMNTAMNPQGGLYPQGMIDKTQYATPIQRPVSSEMVMEDSAYERSNPMLMAAGGEVKGYAAGGKTMLPQFQGSRLEGDNIVDASGRRIGAIGMAAPTPTPQQDFVNPRGAMSPEMQAYYAQDFANQAIKSQMAPRIAIGLPQSQPTGQSTFPSATSMQGGFGQGAQGYPSFTMGSGGGSAGGSAGGAFPLEGRYGIVKMAPGGIASFAKGTPRERDSYGEFQRYQAMMEGKKPTAPDEPAWVRSVGIVDDNDPDTKYQDALTASLIRQGKINKRAGTGAPTMARPTPMGTLNFNPPGTQQAASGGIMGYNLGGYADGGNPRLLKGPGDGMSDNIPAVIGRKQPARLADGEFVVPADVVSHLGNGSTDAGAKKLHEMMDKVRMARTGKKKQAPAVKPKKYMPA